MYAVGHGGHMRECKGSLSASCPQLRNNQRRNMNLKFGCATGKTAAVQWGTNTSLLFWPWDTILIIWLQMMMILHCPSIAGLCHQKAKFCVQLEFRVLPGTLWQCRITFRKSCNSSFSPVWGCKNICGTFFCLFSAPAFLNWRFVSCISITFQVFSKVSWRVKRTAIVGSYSCLGSF